MRQRHVYRDAGLRVVFERHRVLRGIERREQRILVRQRWDRCRRILEHGVIGRLVEQHGVRDLERLRERLR
jgi:hypothetical protein